MADNGEGKETLDNESLSGDGGQESGGTGGNDGKVVFSTEQQEWLDKQFAERAKRGKESGQKALFDSLGVSDADELKGKLDALKKFEDGQKSELEKLTDDLSAAQDQVSTLENDLTATQQALNETRMRSAVLFAARDADFIPQALEDIWMLVSNNEDLNSMLAIDEDTNQVSGAEKVVKKVVKERPHWVQAKQQRGTPRRGSQPPASRKSDTEGTEREAPLVRF